MCRSAPKLVAVTLALCLLALSGFLYPQTVAHAAHHESHHGQDDGQMGHGTALCSWMCAAGQGVETFTVSLATRLQPVAVVFVSPPVPRDMATPISTPTRAPPCPSLCI